ncbi:MAG: hypothetical protein ACREP9_21435 [Candidatus Dormibacteraceae bacterium]
MDHLSGFHSCGGFEQGCENRLIRAYFIARHVGDDDGYFERIRADEVLEFAINGNESVEGVLRVIQQWSVFTATPTNFGDGLNGMAGESRFESSVDAFV